GDFQFDVEHPDGQKFGLGVLELFQFDGVLSGDHDPLGARFARGRSYFSHGRSPVQKMVRIGSGGYEHGAQEGERLEKGIWMRDPAYGKDLLALERGGRLERGL